MRIAILTNAYPPDAQGGAGRIAEIQAQLLQQAGHEVNVFHPKILWFQWPAWLRLVLHFNDGAPRGIWVLRILKWRPEVLITHNLTGCGFGTPRWVQRQGVRWLHVLHDVQLFEPSGQLVEVEAVTPWQRFWGWCRLHWLGQPDVVISPTQWLLDLHRRRGFFRKTASAIIPNPLPTEVVALHQGRAQVTEKMRLLFVGRVSPDKGSRVMEEVIQQLAQHDVAIDFDVVGEGSDLERLQKLPAMISHGPVAPARVVDLMRRSHVLLVPSQIIENQPTVILEAASVGLPVIASAIGGIPETLRGAGGLCAPGDIRAWVDAILSLREPEKYQQATEEMSALAKWHHPQKYLQSLEEVLTRKR